MINDNTKVLDEIRKTLDAKGVVYDYIEHEPVHTSEQAAEIRGCSLDMGAKALVLLADGKPLLAVIPGDAKLKSSKLRKLIGAKDVRFAKPDFVSELTGLKIGSIPPFGSLLGPTPGLPRYFDEAIAQKEKVAFNPGIHEASIIMPAQDLIAIENPVISSIT